MKSIILCEGRTDFLFLQHFMINTYSWFDSGRFYTQYKSFLDGNRVLIKGNNELVIAFCGGCSKISNALEKILIVNKNSGLSEKKYDNIIIISDNDDEYASQNIHNAIKKKIDTYSNDSIDLNRNEWKAVKFIDSISQSYNVRFLYLMIPPDSYGALETFILNSIADKNEYDKSIIEKGNHFVQTVDPQNKYISKRRDFEKSKYNVFLSIRMPELDFIKLHDLFKNIPWQNYPYMTKALSKLKEISE